MRPPWCGPVVALLVVTLAPSTSTSAAPEGVIYLQPLGSDSGLPRDRDLALAQTALERFYRLEVRRLPPLPLPPRAYYRPRARWRAEILLEELAARRPRDARFVLGVTAADISTTKGRVFDWGILGLGAFDGSAAVVSSLRTGRGARSPEHARERLGKVAVHEIGHNLGLPHCSTRGCLMEDAAGKVATCDREYDLCPHCRRTLADGGLPLPPADPPWPRP